MPSHRVLLELTKRYNEPHRFYHSLEHIAWMLNEGRTLELSEDQILAIWFHDAVYAVPGATNEEDSAALARTLLAAEGHPEPRIVSVEQMILDTKAHLPTTDSSKLVVDLDLAPLSVPWEEFAANTDKLLREYAGFPPEQVASGRRGFLLELLARERIYTTPWGTRREAQARANIRRVIG